MENKVILQGTNEEQAKQLWDILCSKHISAEELKEFVPISNDFFSALSDVLQREIESENSAYKEFHSSMQMIVEVCKAALADGRVSKDERLRIIELLDKINERIVEVQIKIVEQKTGFKKFVAACGSAVMALIVIVIGKNGPGINKRA